MSDSHAFDDSWSGPQSRGGNKGDAYGNPYCPQNKIVSGPHAPGTRITPGMGEDLKQPSDMPSAKNQPGPWLQPGSNNVDADPYKGRRGNGH